MNLRQLEVFHAVMRAGTVTGAARLLGVNRSTLYRRLGKPARTH